MNNGSTHAEAESALAVDMRRKSSVVVREVDFPGPSRRQSSFIAAGVASRAGSLLAASRAGSVLAAKPRVVEADTEPAQWQWRQRRARRRGTETAAAAWAGVNYGDARTLEILEREHELRAKVRARPPADAGALARRVAAARELARAVDAAAAAAATAAAKEAADALPPIPRADGRLLALAAVPEARAASAAASDGRADEPAPRVCASPEPQLQRCRADSPPPVLSNSESSQSDSRANFYNTTQIAAADAVICAIEHSATPEPERGNDNARDGSPSKQPSLTRIVFPSEQERRQRERLHGLSPTSGARYTDVRKLLHWANAAHGADGDATARWKPVALSHGQPPPPCARIGASRVTADDAAAGMQPAADEAAVRPPAALFVPALPQRAVARCIDEARRQKRDECTIFNNATLVDEVLTKAEAQRRSVLQALRDEHAHMATRRRLACELRAPHLPALERNIASWLCGRQRSLPGFP